MKTGHITCEHEGCYQTFRLGGECPVCWMKEGLE